MIEDLVNGFWGEKGPLTCKNWHNGTMYVSFRCRMCKVCFSNPNELRMHSMVEHKGHMLL